MALFDGCPSLLLPAILSSNILAQYIIDYEHAFITKTREVVLNDGKSSETIFTDLFFDCGLHLTVLMKRFIHFFHTEQFREFHRGRGRAFLKVIRNINYILDRLNMDGSEDVHSIRLMVPRYTALLTALLPEEACRARELWSIIQNASALERCFLLDCPDASVSMKRGPMQRCSRCHIAMYSSRECQAHSWSDTRAPHRKICKNLKGIMDMVEKMGKKNTDFVSFRKAVSDAKVDDSIMEDIIVWFESIERGF